MRFSRREIVALAALPAAAALGWAVRRHLQGRSEAPHDDSEETPALSPSDLTEYQELRRLADSIVPLYAKLRAPQPDEWLAKHVEFGQTFARFLADRPARLADDYGRIAVVPVGELSPEQHELCALAAEYLQCFFGLAVDVCEPAPLEDVPDECQRLRDSGERQVLTRYIMQRVLMPLCTDDTAAVVGITACDLWDGDFNFLFGQGSAAERVCICSVARFGETQASGGEALVLRRTIGLATHETGHVFRLPHCTAYSCRMNGSNHLAESDSRPLEFCPECLPKVWWTCGVDPLARFDKRADFAARHGLTDEERFWRAARGRLNGLR